MTTDTGPTFAVTIANASLEDLAALADFMASRKGRTLEQAEPGAPTVPAEEFGKLQEAHRQLWDVAKAMASSIVETFRVEHGKDRGKATPHEIGELWAAAMLAENNYQLLRRSS